jgi:hypothetical protein
VLRTYAPAAAEAAAAAAPFFLVELQRRRGCVRVFGRAYDRLCAHLGLRGLLAEDSPAAARLRAMHADLALASARGGAARGGAPFLPAPLPPAAAAMRDAMRDMAAAAAARRGGGDDGTATADDDEHEADAEAEALAAHGRAGSDGAAVVAACVSLAGALASAYDDVCAPAAQSLALLALSPRVRDALAGALAACAAPAPAAAERAGLAALGLLSGLAARAADGAGGTSLECRTAAAVALSQLTRAPAVADALLVLREPLLALLDAAAAAEVCAGGACLRRQLLRAALHVVAPGAARLAAAGVLAGVRLRADALARAPHAGADARFDAIVRKLAARLAV